VKSDYYFAKCLGCEINTLYSSDVYNSELQKYELSFPKRMFCGVARILNVLCYFIKEPNYIIDGKKRFILLKVPYSFNPGENRIVSSD